MPYRINHIHLKASDPRKTADWYVKAFAFKRVPPILLEQFNNYDNCHSSCMYFYADIKYSYEHLCHDNCFRSMSYRC